MYANPLQAYETAGKTTTSSRELEADRLFKAARLLEACQQSWDAADRDSRVDAALRYNSKLWTLFQTELARPDHAMPAELRINLLQLSRFVDKRTLELQLDPSAQGLQALIDINRNVAAGLGQRAAA